MSISTRAWSFPVPGRCCKALSRAGRGLLFSEKSSKRILAKLVFTCRRRGAFCKGVVSTARRGGVPFTRVRRRGLCSMSGRYPYGIGNPPTLRRSSFPQRASRPAGGPIPKHAWGCAPRPRRVGAPPPGKPKRRLPGELGPPAGRKARWGKEDAPKRGGLPEAQQRVSTTQAEVASDATTLIRCRRRILCRDSVTSKVFA